MDSQDVQVIVQALTAGASAGALGALTDQVKDAVKGAYTKLRDLIQQQVGDNPGAQLALVKHEASPDAWGPALTAELTDVRVGDEADILAAARALLELVNQASPRGDTYNVTISGGQGVQFGSGNTQTNTFNNR